MSATTQEEYKISQGEAQKIETKQLEQLICLLTGMEVASGVMLFSARPVVARKLFADSQSLGLFLTRLAAVGASVEFFTNPIFGKLSDTYGRLPCLQLGNLTVGPIRAIMFLNAGKKWPIMLEQGLGIPMVTSFFVASRAALADVLDAQQMALAMPKVGAAAGMAVIIGPIITELTIRIAEPKYCYLMSALLRMTSLIIMRTKLKETLPKSKRKPLVLSDMQPFGFIQLFQKSKVLGRIMIATGLQTLTEGRATLDVTNIYCTTDVGWSVLQLNRFLGFYGIALVAGGLMGPNLLKRLGARLFTHQANAANAANYYLMCCLPPFHVIGYTGSLFLGGLLGNLFGSRKRDALEAIIVKIGKAEGFGNGFIQACMNNFRALPNVIAPLIFGSIYAHGSKRKMPYLVWLVCMVINLLASIPLPTLTNKELHLDEEGHIQKG